MAQLVARSVRDAEVVGSSPITLTIFYRLKNKIKKPPLSERFFFLRFLLVSKTTKDIVDNRIGKNSNH